MKRSPFVDSEEIVSKRLRDNDTLLRHELDRMIGFAVENDAGGSGSSANKSKEERMKEARSIGDFPLLGCDSDNEAAGSGTSVAHNPRRNMNHFAKIKTLFRNGDEHLDTSSEEMTTAANLSVVAPHQFNPYDELQGKAIVQLRPNSALIGASRTHNDTQSPVMDDDNNDEADMALMTALGAVPANSNYKSEKCTRLFAATSNFLSTHCKERSRHSVVLIDCAVNSKHYLDSNSPLTFGDLRTAFNECGHAISLCYQSNYSVPLVLDFDCKHCKTNKNNNACGPMALSMLSFINGAVQKAMVGILPTGRATPKCLIFKRDAACSLHLYFNFNVSITLNDLIIEHLRAELPASVTSKYYLDNIASIGLPYSAKEDGDVYRQCHPLNVDDEWLVAGCSNSFLDVDVQIVQQANFSEHKILGRITTTRELKSEENIWDDLDCQKSDLVTPIVPKAIPCTGQNPTITYLRMSNCKFVSLQNGNLEAYVNAGTFNSLEINLRVNELMAALQSDTENGAVLLLIHERIQFLATKLPKLTNQEPLHNLIGYLVAHDCGYAFYMIIGFAKYIMMSMSRSKASLEYKIFRLVLLYFRRLLCYTNEFRELCLLSRTFETCLDFQCYQKLSEYIRTPGNWLSHVVNEVLFHSEIDTLALLHSTASTVRTMDDLKAIILKFMHRTQIAMRRKSMIYMYNRRTGLYEEHVNSASFANTSLVVSLIENTSLFFDTIVPQTKFNDAKLKFNKTFYLSLFIESLEDVDVKFNMYAFFIATQLGVFNTLTGTYMPSVPCLHFRVQKAYGPILPGNEDRHTVLSANSMLLEMYLKLQSTVSTIIERQTDLYLLSVVVPGLLTINEYYVPPQRLTAIYRSLWIKILNCNTTSAHLFYMLPVIQHWKFDLDRIIQIANFLLQHVVAIGPHYDIFLSGVCNQTAEGMPSVEKRRDFNYDKTYDTNEELLIELFNVYKNFMPGVFILSYIAAIFDYNHNNQWKVERNSPLKYTPVTDGRTGFCVDFEYGDHLYSARHSCNHTRAYTTLFHGHDVADVSVLNILYSLSVTFQFDSQTLDEFLTSFAIHYNPATARKRFTILIGPPKCGKTVFVKMLESMSGTAKYNTSASFIMKEGSGPAPEQIAMFSSYLVSVSEVTNVNAACLKVITGDEELTRRYMFQNELFNIQPVAHMVGTTNSIPVMKNVDEAIRDRLTFFEFGVQYIESLDKLDSLGVDKIEDNPLLMYDEKVIFMPEVNRIEDPKALANILYVQYMAKRNECGVIVHEVRNMKSTHITKRFLEQNHMVYRILGKCDIVYQKGLWITIDQLSSLVTPHLTETLTLDKFLYQFRALFDRYARTNDPDTFQNIGISSRSQAQSSTQNNLEGEFLRYTGDNTKIVSAVELVRRLVRAGHQEHMARSLVHDYAKEFPDRYDARRRVFIGVHFT